MVRARRVCFACLAREARERSVTALEHRAPDRRAVGARIAPRGTETPAVTAPQSSLLEERARGSLGRFEGLVGARQ